jgi:hypothetical protein
MNEVEVLLFLKVEEVEGAEHGVVYMQGESLVPNRLRLSLRIRLGLLQFTRLPVIVSQSSE